MTMAVICPVCGEDWVRRARLDHSDVTFWLCTECDSVWMSQEWVGALTSEYLGDFLRDLGRPPLHSEFTVEPRPARGSTGCSDAQ
jgi:hypothetical protein